MTARIISTAEAAFPSLGTDRNALTYEQQLNENRSFALNEGGLFFEEKGAVHETLRKIGQRLNELEIPYVVVGGMALFQHGYRRFTEDVDLLVKREDLSRIHRALVGLGYVRPFEKSKNLRDAQWKVKIEFLLTGDFPGDGKPKEVAFPDPETVGVEIDGIRYLSLPALVELKLASGMTSPDRLKDLVDVQELIKLLHLEADFADQLQPSVRSKFQELWRATRATPKRYILIWRNKFLTLDADNLDEMIADLTNASETLKAMRADGVILDPDGGTADDYAYLVTTDPQIAAKYGMHDEAEYFDEEPTAEDREPKRGRG